MSNRHRSPPNLRSTLNESRPSPSLCHPLILVSRENRVALVVESIQRLHGNCFHGATTARFIGKLTRTKVACCLVRHYGDFSSQGLFQSSALNESVHRSFVPRFHEPRAAVNALADDSDADLRDWKGLEGEDWSKIEEYEGKFVRRD